MLRSVDSTSMSVSGHLLTNDLVEESEQVAVNEYRTKMLKRATVFFLFCLVVLVIVDIFVWGITRDIIIDFLDWVSDHPIEGVAAFAGVYVVCTVLFIPGSILTLGAGLVFGTAFGLGPGVAIGTFAVFIGASIGATLSFLLGRYALQGMIQDKVGKYPILSVIDKVMSKDGLFIMCLLRLSPLIPFSALNYIIATTNLKLRDYLLALFAMLPGTAAYVFIGTTAGSLLGEDNVSGSSDETTETVETVCLVVGGAAALGAVAAISYYARKILQEAIDNAESDEESGLEARVTNSGSTLDSDHVLHNPLVT